MERDAVDNLLLDYAHAIDDGKLSEWPDFFSENATYHILTRESFEAGHSLGIMYCQGRGMMRDRMLALETANIYEPHTYCHILSRPQITGPENGLISARTNFQVLRTMQGRSTEIFAAGKYLDIIEALSSGLRFRERKVILDSRRVDILLVFPL